MLFPFYQRVICNTISPPPVPTRCPTPLLRCPTGPANIFIGLLPKCSSSECQVLSFSIPTVGCLLKPFAFSRVTLATCRRNVILKGKRFGRGDTIWPMLATFFFWRKPKVLLKQLSIANLSCYMPAWSLPLLQAACVPRTASPATPKPDLQVEVSI